MSSARSGAILLPGVVMPAFLAYADLLEELGGEAVAKELELYREQSPPPDYALEVEIDGVLRVADENDLERFHLVGYSGGGAVSLALAARHPQRLLSLALGEPAWDGNWELSPEEERLWRQFDGFDEGGPSDGELMSEFFRLQLRPGVEPPEPPPGPPPPWMEKRPEGIRALTGAFSRESIDPDRLRAFDRPVYFALGSLSNPDYWQKMAERLARTFPDFTIEVYEGRHHLDPPHRAEPQRFAAALRAHWARAEADAP